MRAQSTSDTYLTFVTSIKPTVSRLSSFDVYRDGGSLSTSFFDPSGIECTLMFSVSLVARESGIECVGYRQPVLERHVPVQRVSPITGINETSWTTESMPMSWQEASCLLEEMLPLISSFRTEYEHVYPSMVEIANAKGRSS
jgi:hypothetical protein